MKWNDITSRSKIYGFVVRFHIAEDALNVTMETTKDLTWSHISCTIANWQVIRRHKAARRELILVNEWTKLEQYASNKDNAIWIRLCANAH